MVDAFFFSARRGGWAPILRTLSCWSSSTTERSDSMFECKENSCRFESLVSSSGSTWMRLKLRSRVVSDVRWDRFSTVSMRLFERDSVARLSKQTIFSIFATLRNERSNASADSHSLIPDVVSASFIWCSQKKGNVTSLQLQWFYCLSELLTISSSMTSTAEGTGIGGQGMVTSVRSSFLVPSSCLLTDSVPVA